MKKIIYDCDNTIGLSGKDVDDGLTLLYLLGRDDIELLGVTLTHGNSSVDEVYKNTINMMDALGINNIPMHKGADSIMGKTSEAAVFLANMARVFPGEITILATGAMTNLYEAYLYDNRFYENLKSIVIMGGITEPLLIAGSNIDELNFSCDAEAAYSVLTSGADLTILTGNTCLQALFGEREIDLVSSSKSNKILDYINENIKEWVNLMYSMFGTKGFCNWDAAAAVYITNPELFYSEIKDISPSIEDLRHGLISFANKGRRTYKVNIPVGIKDILSFNDTLIRSWQNIK